MEITIPYSYSKDVIPPRCRKPRTRCFTDGLFHGKILDLDAMEETAREDAFPVAFILYSHLYKTEGNAGVVYRGYTGNGKLYKREDGETRNSLRIPYHLRSERNSEKENEDNLREWLDTLLIYHDEVWRMAYGEPCYKVETFGSGQCYISTDTLSDYTLQQIMEQPGNSFFRADELDLAKEMALGMARDQENIDSIQNVEETFCRIDVYRIDFSRMMTRENREAEALNYLVKKVLMDKLDYSPKDISAPLCARLMRSVWKTPGYQEAGAYEKERMVISSIREMLNESASSAIRRS